jgi:hypothetical protein
VGNLGAACEPMEDGVLTTGGGGADGVGVGRARMEGGKG